MKRSPVPANTPARITDVSLGTRGKRTSRAEIPKRYGYVQTESETYSLKESNTYLVFVFVGKAEAARSAFLSVELDQHGRLVDHDLRGDVFERTAVCVLTLNMAARQKPDVRVHANVGADDWLHVGRPAKAGRIDRALDSPVCGADDVDLGPAHLAVVGSLDGID